MENDKIFRDKVAVVTGGGGKLCSCVARNLVERGARVAVIGRTMGKLAAVAEEINAQGGICVPKTGDVSSEESLLKATAELE